MVLSPTTTSDEKSPLQSLYSDSPDVNPTYTFVILLEVPSDLSFVSHLQTVLSHTSVLKFGRVYPHITGDPPLPNGDTSKFTASP